MSTYDSGIYHHHHRRRQNDRPGHPVELFGRGSSLHSTFGGGKGKIFLCIYIISEKHIFKQKKYLHLCDSYDLRLYSI